MPVLPLYQVNGRRLMGRLGYLSAMRYQVSAAGRDGGWGRRADGVEERAVGR